MSLKTIVGATAGFTVKQIIRSHHIYRPISYCDWYKPPNSFYYELRCPPKKEPVCKPAIVREKRCAVCSFWQQLKDNCCGFFWPLPPQPMPAEPKVHVCKDGHKEDVSAKEKCKRKRCFTMDDCYNVPDCPKPNWRAYVPTH